MGRLIYLTPASLDGFIGERRFSNGLVQATYDVVGHLQP